MNNKNEDNTKLGISNNMRASETTDRHNNDNRSASLVALNRSSMHTGAPGRRQAPCYTGAVVST